MRVVTILLFVVCCSGAQSPTLWGSRVVAKTSGPSDTMRYYFDGEIEAQVNIGSKAKAITLQGDQCVDGSHHVWGSPCRKVGGDVYITMADVRAQDSLLLINKQPQIGMGSTTFFVPKCKFPRPASGEVDLNTSFPLSRFVKGTKSFNVDFAVGGANSSSNVTFYINGTHHCIWNGTKIGYKGSEICVDLVKDEKADLRVFHGVFPTKTNVARESFRLVGNTTYVIVSVDYTQNGTSPEVAECNRCAKMFHLTGAIVSLLTTLILLVK